jgi:hypothetical protein|tara:strand:+ start:93 stop:218 length:126 start_codon:yes stop_codon:yes gene_type:complete
MTVSQLRRDMTQEEFVYWAAYFDLKNERERQAQERAKAQRR